MSRSERGNRTILFLVVLVGVLIVGIWIGAWFVGAQKAIFSGLTNEPLADVFSSVNALFAGLAFGGVIITIYVQIRELQDTKEELQKTAQANAEMATANLSLARLSDERSVMDLFQVYCSEYFQTVKNASMSVLIPCVASKAYGDYVVSRLLVAGQLPFPDHCWERVSEATYSKSLEEFRAADQHQRYKLDELINFFTMLTGRANAKEAVSRCDFSYSWWRPLLWMLAVQQRNRYDADPEIRRFATPLYLMDVVRKLDESYNFTPFASDRDMWQFFVSHPKVQGYGMDPAYRALSLSA